MAKRKRYSRIRRAFRPRRQLYRYRRGKKRLSIIGTTGLIGSVFAPADGRDSLGGWLMRFMQGYTPQGQDLYHMANDTLAQYTGIDTRANMPRFSIPWGLVTVIVSQFGAKLANRFGRNAIEGVPFIGKFLKW